MFPNGFRYSDGYISPVRIASYIPDVVTKLSALWVFFLTCGSCPSRILIPVRNATVSGSDLEQVQTFPKKRF